MLIKAFFFGVHGFVTAMHNYQPNPWISYLAQIQKPPKWNGPLISVPLNPPLYKYVHDRHFRGWVEKYGLVCMYRPSGLNTYFACGLWQAMWFLKLIRSGYFYINSLGYQQRTIVHMSSIFVHIFCFLISVYKIFRVHCIKLREYEIDYDSVPLFEVDRFYFRISTT